MGFQALFKFVQCWRAPDIVRETVQSSWGYNIAAILTVHDTIPWEIFNAGLKSDGLSNKSGTKK